MKFITWRTLWINGPNTKLFCFLKSDYCYVIYWARILLFQKIQITAGIVLNSRKTSASCVISHCIKSRYGPAEEFLYFSMSCTLPCPLCFALSSRLPSSVSPSIQPSHFEVQVPGTASRSDWAPHLKDSILQSDDASAQNHSQPPFTCW